MTSFAVVSELPLFFPEGSIEVGGGSVALGLWGKVSLCALCSHFG